MRSFSLPLHEFLAMAESCPITWNRPGKIRPGSIGVPLEAVLLRVVDADGNEVKPGEVGELMVKSPGNTIGYWNNPEATAETLRDGWLCTGISSSKMPKATTGSPGVRRNSSSEAVPTFRRRK